MNMQTVSQTVSQPVNLASSSAKSLWVYLSQICDLAPTLSRMSGLIQKLETFTSFWKLKAKTMTQLLKYEDVQARLRISRSSVLRLIDKGLLERIYIFKEPRITDTAVETFIKNQTLATRRNQVGA